MGNMMHNIPHDRTVHFHDHPTVLRGVLAFVLVMALASRLKLRRKDLHSVEILRGIILYIGFLDGDLEVLCNLVKRYRIMRCWG